MARRPNRLAPRTRPALLFLAGILLIVPFLLQTNLPIRMGQVALFGVLAWIAGKRIRWLYFVVMVASITFFNLLTPVGELLVELGPLRITRGALEQGLLKGFAIVGLVFISLFSVRPDLKLPGSLGGLLGRLFYYFELIFESRKKVSARRLVESVDEVLESIYPVGEHPAPPPASPLPAGGNAEADYRCRWSRFTGCDSRSVAEARSVVGASAIALIVVACWTAALASMFGLV